MSLDVRELLSREVTPEQYREIRELWKTHSIAEDRRDIAGLISTLTPDCLYEVLPDGGRWEGHGTHKGKWLDRAPNGQEVEFRVVIFFPWDSAKRKFAGERVFAFL
jgi:hypothetical protein